MAFVVVWDFRVRKERVTEFEKIYSAEGDWVRLFERGDGFLGSHLMRDESSPVRFMAIDRWRDSTAYEAFHWRFQKEYDALNQRCAGLLDQEIRVGTFETLGRQTIR